MIRRLSTLALVAFALTLSAGPADALVSIHGDDLEAWLVQKRFDLRNETQGTGKQQRKAVDKATTKFGKDSADLTGDAKVISKTLKPLAKPFQADVEFDGLVGDVLGGLDDDLAERRSGFEGLADRLDDKQAVDYLIKKLAAADRKIAKIDAAGDDVAKRSKALWKSFQALDKLDKRVLPAVQAGLGDDRFLYLTGDGNHAARVFSPTRQTDDTDLTPDQEGEARNQFENGDSQGEVGNELLILNWTDTNGSGAVDRVRVQMFRLIGLDDQPEAWVLDTFSRGLGFDGISVDQTPDGTRVSFRNTRLVPDAGTNSAEGELILNGSLLLDIDSAP